MKGYLRLFISHVDADKAAVHALKVALEDYGVSAFVAHDDIAPSHAWVDTIELALATCDALLAYLTMGFHQSQWTDQEVGFALSRDVLVLPVMVDDVAPYGFMGRVQAVRASKMAPDALAKAIVDVLTRSERTAEAMASGLVSSLEDSRSFREASTRMGRLSAVVNWTPALLRRLEGAPFMNSQVENAYGVTEAIARMVAANRG